MLSRREFAAAMAAPLILPEIAMAADAAPSADPIREGYFADINGLPQWITIRAAAPGKPVLLMLHGGPGIPMSFMTPLFSPWEDHFTLVQWDQPGSGATWSKTPQGQGELTRARYIRDAIAVTEHICARLGVPKVALFGMSWGSVLGANLIHQRPDLYSGYVGASQPVSGPRGGPLGWRLGLEAAKVRGDAAGVAALTRVGPGPYAAFADFLVRQQYTNPPGMPLSPAEAAASAQVAAVFQAPPPDTTYMAKGLPPQDGMAVFMATQTAVFQEAARWEIRDLGPRFEVPVFVIQGELDYNCPASLAREWIGEITAPKKAYAEIPACSHNTLSFPDVVFDFVREHLLG
ncbi:MAG: alpha/beta hydrolase [Caulobacteraceae bacterium]